jgi:hypothetical protein
MSKFKSPFVIARVFPEQDTFDRFDFWGKMFVVQPVTDCPIAETDGAGELLDAPLPSWVIRFPAWPPSLLAHPRSGRQQLTIAAVSDERKTHSLGALPDVIAAELLVGSNKTRRGACAHLDAADRGSGGPAAH